MAETTVETTEHDPGSRRDASARFNREDYLNWSAILAGTAIAVTVGLLLNAFGAAVGLYVLAPWSSGGPSLTSQTFGAAIWTALVAMYSVAMGAYLAGRMRPRVVDADRAEVSFRDGASGLVVWALSVLFGILVVSVAISGTARTMVSALSAGGSAIGVAASETADLVAPIAERSIDALFDDVQEAKSPAEEGSPTDVAQKGAALQQPATQRSAATNSLATAVETSEAERRKLLRIVRRTAIAGSLSASDRDYLRNIVAAKTGISVQEAEERVSRIATQALTQAKEVAQAAKDSIAISGFWTVFVTLLAGLAAWWAGSIGGAHRDDAHAK